jgi:hypothetical protein
MRLFLLCSLLAIGLPQSFARSAAHDFHISKMLVAYAPDEQTLQVSAHLFIDDLELALREGGAPKLRLATENEHPEAETYLQAYLRRELAFIADGRELDYTVLGRELSDDLAALWVYIEVPLAQLPEELQIRNALLTDIYADQKNIVKYSGATGRSATLLMQRGSTVASLQP